MDEYKYKIKNNKHIHFNNNNRSKIKKENLSKTNNNNNNNITHYKLLCNIIIEKIVSMLLQFFVFFIIMYVCIERSPGDR